MKSLEQWKLTGIRAMDPLISSISCSPLSLTAWKNLSHQISYVHSCQLNVNQELWYVTQKLHTLSVSRNIQSATIHQDMIDIWPNSQWLYNRTAITCITFVNNYIYEWRMKTSCMVQCMLGILEREREKHRNESSEQRATRLQVI